MLALSLCLAAPASVSAQEDMVAAIAAAATVEGSPGASLPPALGAGNTPIATEVLFSGDSIAYGDIISYDPDADTYVLSTVANDSKMYGVVVQTPALLFDPSDGGVPVTRSGQVLINVTLENGPIAEGDSLTSSSIPGKAMKADSGQAVVAIASEPFTGTAGIALEKPDGESVLAGTITAKIIIGASGAADAANACTTSLCRIIKNTPPLFLDVARYGLAGLIAAISLILAFRSFMSDVTYGVISMGRNPLAKKSIVSMVAFNAFLAVLMGGGGVVVALMVLFTG